MSEAIDCVAAGHICLDISPEIFASSKSVEEIFRAGVLVNVGPATTSTGGAVSNVGLALRRLGIGVTLMGKCGDDAFGRMVIDKIRTEAPGAETGMRLVRGEHTSYTVVVAPPGVDRMFLHCPGANDTFGAEDVDLDIVGRARLFHFGYPPIMERMFADGGRELVAMLAEVKDAGATTSVDMSYPDPDSAGGRADWASILTAALPHVDIFTPSVEELTFMLRRPRWDALADEGDVLAGIDGALLSELADACLEAGPAVVLIKCGHFGAYIRTAGADRLARFGRAAPADIDAWADRELFEPTYAVNDVVSATGAGDNTIAGFLAATLRGRGPADAVRYACAVGAQNVRVRDAVSGVQSWDETTAQIQSRPPKNDVPIPLDGWRHDPDQAHYVGPNDRGG